jgi:hypothetical protein
MMTISVVTAGGLVNNRPVDAADAFP